MFIGREKELQELRGELLSWNHKTAILVYGKRRVGKSTLINEASKCFEGIVINHICVSSTFEGNLNLLFKSVSEALSLPEIIFNSLQSMMDFIGKTEKKILLIIDEYPYLKQTKKQYEVDSIMQAVIDRLPSNVKLILCGSYITIMKELMEESNPLFGRFSLIQHIRDFDYYDASKFYPELSVRDKVAFYAVFGGSPFVLEHLDSQKDLKSNIIKNLLPETGIIRIHIENTILKEIQKSFDSRILESLGNGKKRYSEIREWLRMQETGLLDKQLKILLDMESIIRTEPINRKGDKKKQFYEITDNLMRFYFTYVFGKTGNITRIGPELFFENRITESLSQFICRRFEGVVLQYFHRMSMNGDFKSVEDFGTYWYDDPEHKKNGEFDCVIKRTDEKYDFYECKYFDRKMSYDECVQEEEQLKVIQGIQVSKIGFVSINGFDFMDNGKYKLIDGKQLYK